MLLCCCCKAFSKGKRDFLVFSSAWGLAFLLTGFAGGTGCFARRFGREVWLVCVIGPVSSTFLLLLFGWSS